MKKLFYTAMVACMVTLFAACSKKADDTPDTSANSKLIVGTYTATKVETSTTNNGSDWKDIVPATTVRETLTIRADNTFSTASSNPVTGATGATTNGTWSLSADGNTLTYVGIQSYAIVTLTSTGMVTTLVGPNKLFTVDQTQYPYYRFTYTRI